jgi:hypothetical protein
VAVIAVRTSLDGGGSLKEDSSGNAAAAASISNWHDSALLAGHAFDVLKNLVHDLVRDRRRQFAFDHHLDSGILK